MEIKRFTICLLLLVLSTFLCYAQTSMEIKKEINKIKRDTNYIYAESTNKNLNEASENAQTIFEIQIKEWGEKQYPNDSIETCIVKAKEKAIKLDTRRGELYRAFVYVKKSDIMPVSCNSNVKVVQLKNTPVKESVVANEHEGVLDLSKGNSKEMPAIQLTAAEEEMRKVKRFYDIEPYITALTKSKQVEHYGKYANMPQDEDCYLFVYDRDGKIRAWLKKQDRVQYNLKTLQQDNINNYRNCGAIWFQFK